MYSIFQKTLNQYLYSSIGYIFLGTFIVFTNLLLWFFPNEFNVIDWGYADMSRFFSLTPWMFLVLLPVITMQLIQSERQNGTLTLLLSSPISISDIVIGKFLAASVMLVLALLFSVPSLVSIYNLALPSANLDYGAIWSSYLGILLLGETLISIGIFSSSVTKNQIASFLISIIICFTLYIGLSQMGEFLSGFLGDFLSFFSLSKKEALFSRGVISISDVFFFLISIFMFLWLSISIIKPKDAIKTPIKSRVFYYTKVLSVILICLYLSSFIKYRIDLTKDKSYTLSQTTDKIVSGINFPIHINVYLDGELPSAFKKLSQEARIKLEDISNLNKNISFSFTDPTSADNQEQIDNQLYDLSQRGFSPINLKMKVKGETKSKLIVPWAELIFEGKYIRIPLLIQINGKSDQEQINASIENLEYVFSKAINKAAKRNPPLIAFSRGHNELEEAFIASAANELSESYEIKFFSFDNKDNGIAPDSLLKELEKVKVLIIAKPETAFSEQDKYLIDQYIMRGGSTLWLIDEITAETDSMMRSGEQLAFSKELNITDLLFKYGVRIQKNIVQDLNSAPIKLAVSQIGGATQYENISWNYYPIGKPSDKNPITRNIDGIWTKYPSSIDTIKAEGIKKEVILSSYGAGRALGVPRIISFQEINIPTDFSKLQNKEETFGVLLKGKFTSAYQNRTKPLKISQHLDFSLQDDAAMIVFSDGDIIANQLSKGFPTPLGYDIKTGKTYGNMPLIENSIAFLLKEQDLLLLRNKKITPRLLDNKKIETIAFKIGLMNIFSSLVLLGIFAIIAFLIKKFNR